MRVFVGRCNLAHARDLYGCESLSQRYVCVAAVKALMPSLCVVVHDDACHLHKYAARRAKDRRVAWLLLREIYIYIVTIGPGAINSMLWSKPWNQTFSPNQIFVGVKWTRLALQDSAAAAGIAPPKLTYVCDKFHMAGHTDAWCRKICDPDLPEHAVLKGIRTSVCEFTFTWLSKYKHQTKHMNEYGFKILPLGHGVEPQRNHFARRLSARGSGRIT